jgi:hypothetical protein
MTIAFTARSYSRAVVRSALPLLAVAILLAGCGSVHARRPPLSAEAFRTQADRICVETKTHAERLAHLRKLRPPTVDDDIYARWLKAESDAVAAAKPPRRPPAKPPFDPGIAVTIAEGKIAGYARRLGALNCM